MTRTAIAMRPANTPAAIDRHLAMNMNHEYNIYIRGICGVCTMSFYCTLCVVAHTREINVPVHYFCRVENKKISNKNWDLCLYVTRCVVVGVDVAAHPIRSRICAYWLRR